MYSFMHPDGRRVFLVDTPGFDDAMRNDTEILKEIAYLMKQLYLKQTWLSGVVYLHRITDERMRGSSLKGLSVMKKLCGDHGYGQIALTTNMWSKFQADGAHVGRNRESQMTQIAS